MEVKRSLVRRKPTDEEVNNLLFPRDKFDLISVDYVDEWVKMHGRQQIAGSIKRYTQALKSVHITVKCKKCGRIKVAATDRPNMSCKVGPCNVRWDDLTGRRFGKLTVVGLERRKNNSNQKKENWYWRCVCDCGDTCYRSSPSLIKSINASCPRCARISTTSKTTLPNGLSRWHRMMRVYKKNANKCGRVFELSEDEFIATASKPCAYCGALPSMSSYKIVCNGIDRIDSSKGYIIGNVTPCCKWCNKAKSDRPVADFINHAIAIARYSGLKLNDHPEREYTPSGVEMGAVQR